MPVKIDPADTLVFLARLRDALADRKLTLEEVKGLIEAALDAASTTPAEALAWAIEELEDLLTGDPDRIRARAANVAERNPKRAARMLERADRIEAKQAA